MSAQKQASVLLQQCYDDYRLKLFNYCLARLSGEREAADDCVQEAFLVFNKRLLDGEEFENPRAFLYRTAENFVKRRQEQITNETKRNVPLEAAEDAAVSDEIYTETLDSIDFDAPDELFTGMVLNVARGKMLKAEIALFLKEYSHLR